MNWSVNKDAEAGDLVYFFCGVTARTRMGSILKDAAVSEDENLADFAVTEANQYQKYAGQIVAVGTLAENPKADPHSHWKNDWRANVSDIRLLNVPVKYSKFKKEVPILAQRTITPLNDDQADLLRKLTEE